MIAFYDAYRAMNRVKHLRKQADLSQGDLAAKMRELVPGSKFSQTDISRWESGERFPRGENLKMLAVALGVKPADLIESILAIDLTEEFESVETAVSSALVKLGIKAYRVLTDSVERAGLAEGALVLLNCSEEAINSLLPGDFVAVEAVNDDGKRVRVLRQYLPPDLVTTNREGTNLSVRLTDSPHTMRIVAKVIPQ